jgi:hypothetical protein
MNLYGSVECFFPFQLRGINAIFLVIISQQRYSDMCLVAHGINVSLCHLKDAMEAPACKTGLERYVDR